MTDYPCPKCGAEQVYNSGWTIKCPTKDCENFDQVQYDKVFGKSEPKDVYTEDDFVGLFLKTEDHWTNRFIDPGEELPPLTEADIDAATEVMQQQMKDATERLLALSEKWREMFARNFLDAFINESIPVFKRDPADLAKRTFPSAFDSDEVAFDMETSDFSVKRGRTYDIPSYNFVFRGVSLDRVLDHIKKHEEE